MHKIMSCFQFTIKFLTLQMYRQYCLVLFFFSFFGSVLKAVKVVFVSEV